MNKITENTLKPEKKYTMKTAIIYATRHGCTEKCAKELANQLPQNAALINLDQSTDINLQAFETIILGGSIHAGSLNKKLSKHIEKYGKTLESKKIGLFLCCMEEGEKAEEQFENAFPGYLKSKAIAKGLFGGEFNFERMNFFEKAIIKKIAKTDQSVSKINYSTIEEFSKKFKTQ